MVADTGKLKSFLIPWHESLEDPRAAQESTLSKLLEGYQETRYGQGRGADQISTIEGFQDSFHIITYEGLKPYIDMVMDGDFEALLPELPVEWALTRGTTGASKFIPLTETDLAQRALLGSRAILNYVYRTSRYDILEGYDLNLNFPSIAGSTEVGGKEFFYGYSSGIYARHSGKMAQLKVVPSQEELDALGGGVTERDWERRFELAYERARDRDVTMLIGVTQTMLHFGSYLKRRWGIYPKDLWDIDIIVATSIAGIQTRFKPALRALYGNAAVVEIYGATEGMYAQQLDERPYVVPNYDTYLFEVETRKGIKMLHELGRGEYGSLVISSCLFPRYKIGDIIRCEDKGYFRVIGRERPFAFLRHMFDRFLDLGLAERPSCPEHPVD